MRSYSLFLLMLAPSVLFGYDVNDRYSHFINQHVNQGMDRNRCDDVIRSRKIKKTDSNECKDDNTFIDSGTNEIKKVCKEAGSQYRDRRDMRVSNQPFPVVTCTLKNNKYHPWCEYRGRSSTVYIIIQCEGDYPVHYEGDRPNIG